MTKKTLANDLYHEFDIDRKQSKYIVDYVIYDLIKALENQDKICFQGLGSFKILNKKARKARNMKTNTIINIPASKVVKFKMSKVLKKDINRTSEWKI